MQNNIVSIIIPNYNNARYLSQCLDSVIKQTYKEIEILIIDDFSNDNSVEIILNYCNNYPDKIRPVLLKENVGVARARHIGIEQSKGEYITTLDADDYYIDRKKLEKEIGLIQNYKKKFNRNIITFSNIIIEQPNGKKIVQGNDNNIVCGNVLNDILIRNCMIPRDFTFLKEAYFEVGGYDFSLKTHEDWDIKIKLASRYEFHFSGIHGTIYRKHSAGLSSSSYRLRTKNLKKVFKKNIHLINNKSDMKTIKNEFKDFMSKRDEDYFQKIINLNNNTRSNFIYKFYNVYSKLGLQGFSFYLKKINCKR